MLIKNKKGDATDPLIVLIVLAFLAISFIIAIFVNTKIGLVISTTDLNTTSVAQNAIIPALDNANLNIVQRGFVVMFAIMVIFIILSAFLIRVHPAFIFIYIISLTITLFASIFIGNLYASLEQNAELAAVMATQPMINIIMKNIVRVIMGVGGLSMFIVFSKLFNAPFGGANQADL